MFGELFEEELFQVQSDQFGTVDEGDDILEIKCQTFYNVKQLVIDEKEVQDKMLQCTICRELLIEPRECTVCQNQFCLECIAEWLKQKPATCPYRCQRPVFRVSHRVIRRHLETLVLKCPNHSKGCSKLIQQQQLRSHLKNECEFCTVQCRNIGCQKLICRSQFQQHEKTCLSRVVKCYLCKQSFRYDPNHNCLAQAKQTIVKYKTKCDIQKKQLQKLKEILNEQAQQIMDFKHERRQEKYQCRQKHLLKWQPLLKGRCRQCNATNMSEIIRTECEICQEKYCIKCKPVYIFNDKCPIGHTFQQVKDVEFCEICFKSDFFDGWKDFECDLEICNECYGTIDY